MGFGSEIRIYFDYTLLSGGVYLVAQCLWTVLKFLKWSSTVKPAVAVTSIKRDPPLSGHFRVPPNDFQCKCTSIKRAPVQRGQRSAKFAPKR